MSLSRRQFVLAAAASATGWPLILRAQRETPASGTLAASTLQGRTPSTSSVFQHGVASGDPLRDRVILWTRVTAPAGTSVSNAITVRWKVALDEGLTRIIASDTVETSAVCDYTVKIDAGNLSAGRPYFYAFEALGEQSPVGRTKTLPQDDVQRLRFASVSCSNYPAGYFNVYRCLANRPDLDAVIHLGDYIYEFANGVYGDGSAFGRVPLPAGEAVTLSDYRQRYATYRTDIDLQAAHRQHPFIVVWDDHELANDAWSGGAVNHNARDGDWEVRKRAAYQAYLEWMPIRESSSPGIHLYRTFRFGRLADLVMLDTRSLRDKQAPRNDATQLARPDRTLLGATQEAWLFDELKASKRAGTSWRLLGQQILFSPLAPPGTRIQNADVWDGYPAARERVLAFLERERVDNLAVLTGDVHSSWAIDVPRHQRGDRAYDGRTGRGSIAVELVAPAISSPPLFTDAAMRDRSSLLKLFAPHLKYLEGESRGYVLLDITRRRLQADWYFVPTVAERTSRETKATSFVCERGSSRLAPA
jgi:alkaline phosphatase D